MYTERKGNVFGPIENLLRFHFSSRCCIFLFLFKYFWVCLNINVTALRRCFRRRVAKELLLSWCKYHPSKKQKTTETNNLKKSSEEADSQLTSPTRWRVYQKDNMRSWKRNKKMNIKINSVLRVAKVTQDITTIQIHIWVILPFLWYTDKLY